MSTTKYMHFRTISQFGLDFSVVVKPHGGATVAYVEGDIGISYGIAFCHDNDRYDRKKGRTIAEGRMRNERTSKTEPLPVEAFRDAIAIEMAQYNLYRRT
jgi:hypothetical protein